MNIYFECVDVVDADYIYKMKPGRCALSNIEYSTILTHDITGFRNQNGKFFGNSVVVLGDSHSHGFGVEDRQTFAHLLAEEFGHSTRNLAIGSYATLRELEVLKAYTQGETSVVLQYCDNDYRENVRAKETSLSKFSAQARQIWSGAARSYSENKRQGVEAPLRYALHLLGNLDFVSRSQFYSTGEQRSVEAEAEAFATLVARYKSVLREKRFLVFESSGYGRNSKSFQFEFTKALQRHNIGFDFRILDSTKFLGRGEYYFLDGHLTPEGHRRVAIAVNAALNNWTDK